MKEKQKKYKNFGIIIWLVALIIFLNLFFFGFFDFLFVEEGDLFIEEEKEVITLYIDPLPYGVEEKYVNTIREANSYWEKREDVIFKETSLELDADVRVQWVKEFGGEHIGYAYGNEFVEIGIGDSNCLGKWKPYTYDIVLNLAKHELGHILGYDHSNNTNDIMYREILTKYETDIEEIEVLPDGWNRFYPTCTNEGVSEYLFEVMSDEDLNVYIVPSIEEFNKLVDGEEFNHYVDCFLEETTNYKESCIVESGAGIVLENPTLLGLGSSAQFKVKIKEI